MKTSNYIIIAFFVFLFGGVFVLFVSAKIHQRSSVSGLWSEEKKLEPFSVVVAEAGANFHLRAAEFPRMQSFYEKPDSINFPKYGIRNDTLFVFANSGIKPPRLPHEIYGRNIKCIIAKENSFVSLQEFCADTLMLKLNNAAVDAFFDKTKRQTTRLSVQATGSRLKLAGVRLENLDLQLNDSKLNAWDNSITVISGSLKDHSSLSVGAITKISIEVDSTSTYQLNKYPRPRK